MVIYVAPDPADAGDRPVWFELALEPERPARVRDGAPPDPMLGELLRVVDEAEKLAGKDEARAGE